MEYPRLPTGTIWISTSAGLAAFSKNTFYKFSKSQGLFANLIETAPYFDGADLYLLYYDALQYCNPDSLLQQKRIIGPVYPESITINQHERKDPGGINKLSLKYYENDLSFSFSAFDLSQGEQLQYEYQMEGSDTGWINLGINKQLFFSQLAPGHYTLKIRARDLIGNVSEQAWTLPITISAPFWKTIWFYLGCSVVLAFIVYTFYRLRIKQVLAEQQLRNQIARDLHDDIGSTLSGIRLFSSMAENKLTAEGSGATNLLARIGERSEKMRISSRRPVEIRSGFEEVS